MIGAIFFVIIAAFGAIVNFIKENVVMVVMILVLILIAFIVYLIINKRIKKQRETLIDEILDYLNLGNIDSLLKKYDDLVTVKSKQTLENYDDIKYLKERDNLDEVKHVVLMRQDIKRDIESFLQENKFMQRPQYKYAANWISGYLPLAEGFRARIVYITFAGNNRGERLHKND